MFNICYEDMYNAYLDCRKRKKNKKDAKAFELNALYNISVLVDEINAGKYKLRPSSCFIIEYPTMREVFCSAFRDRIVQHFVYNELNPVIDKRLIHDTASCRVGKGTDRAIDRVERFVREATDNYTHDANYVKADLSGFFMSIDRQLLLEKVLVLIDEDYHGKYKNVLKYLVRIIITTDQTINARFLCDRSMWDKLPKRKSLFGNPYGLPIGNITSQMFVNFYMNDIDHYIKSRHKYYERYVDDIVIVDNDKNKLKETLDGIRKMLPNYNLKLNERKTRIGNVKYGIDFLGIKIKPYYSVIGKKRIGRIYYTTRQITDPVKMVQSANSRKGMFKRYHGYRIARRWYESIHERFEDILMLKDYKFIVKAKEA